VTRKSIQNRRILFSYCLLIFVALVFVWPLVFMLAASVTPNTQVLARAADLGTLLSGDLTWSNYKSVLGQLDFFSFLRNSIVIVGAIVLSGLVVNSMAGYALSRLRWRGREAVLAVVIALLVIPYEALAVPLFFEMTVVGWINSYRVQIVPFIANAFSIYLFYTFFNSLPRELDEAARMDRASPLQTFFFIAAPLARPAFASVAILSFLMNWGVFLWPLMVTRGSDYQPLPVALGYFSANKPVLWGDIMAFGTLMVLPVLVVFLIFQKGFVKGIARTGIKG